MAVVKALPDPSGVAQVVNPPLPGAPKVGSMVETAFHSCLNLHFLLGWASVRSNQYGWEECQHGPQWDSNVQWVGMLVLMQAHPTISKVCTWVDNDWWARSTSSENVHMATHPGRGNFSCLSSGDKSGTKFQFSTTGTGPNKKLARNVAAEQVASLKLY